MKKRGKESNDTFCCKDIRSTWRGRVLLGRPKAWAPAYATMCQTAKDMLGHLGYDIGHTWGGSCILS